MHSFDDIFNADIGKYRCITLSKMNIINQTSKQL